MAPQKVGKMQKLNIISSYAVHDDVPRRHIPKLTMPNLLTLHCDTSRCIQSSGLPNGEYRQRKARHYLYQRYPQYVLQSSLKKVHIISKARARADDL